jgi:ABC-2 type transport system ATP-binding protein
MVMGSNNEKAVIVRGLEKRFGSFTAVDKVSFEVNAGEIFGFLGPNGAGKSTTIRMLTGILAPSGGAATVAGFDVIRAPEKIKANIGYMSQKFSLYEDLTVEENIDFYGGIYRIPKARKQQRKDWAVEMAGLQEHRHSRTATLSGGWKQRLALGCAILHEPSVIFLDEPTAGVDPISRRQFWDLIYELAEKHVTIFVTTHYMDEAEYCDRIGFIYHGALIALGTPRALKTDIMRDRVLEVRCDRPQEALDELARLEVVSEAALFGRDLHVVVRDERAALDRIGPALTQAGYAVRSVEPITPSLEDVFVSLIESYDREHSPSRGGA